MTFWSCRAAPAAACRWAGSDQWGNIVNGIELSRRADSTEVYGVTTPLITTADGGKMGKTMSGAVWLNEDQLPHFDYWQFWRNTDDRDVGRFLRLFTDLPLDEIARLEALEAPRSTRRRRSSPTKPPRCAAAVPLPTKRRRPHARCSRKARPAVRCHASRSRTAISPWSTALVALGLCPRRARRARKIAEGAIRVDDQVVSDPALEIAVTAPIELSFGKKNYGLLVPA